MEKKKWTTGEIIGIVNFALVVAVGLYYGWYKLVIAGVIIETLFYARKRY